MNVLLIVVAVIVAVVGAVLVLAAQQPDEFRVTRSAVIKASPQEIFPYINDVKLNHEWSPWVDMEPEAKYEFEGPQAGEGAVVRWSGKKSGQGTATIVESRAPEFVQTRLDFIKPMQSTSTTEISLEPQSGQTNVTWSMYGANTFMAKVMSVFMNCEKMVGGQFEQGLNNLKKTVEG